MPEGTTIEQERLELERRRLALESSFPRKWAPVLFGSLATIAVAIISGAVSWTVTKSQNELTERENKREEHNRQIENTRTALDMYFKNVTLLSEDNDRALWHMKMIAEITESEGVKTVFNDMFATIFKKKLEENPGKPLEEIAVTMPSLSIDASSDSVAYRNFTVYIQYPKSGDAKAEGMAQKVLETLAKQGVRTPGKEPIDPAKVPAASEIRFYSPLQETKLAHLVETLEAATGISFKTTTLKRAGLPESIFEIWIGKNDV